MDGERIEETEEEHAPWERVRYESHKAFEAFNDYCRMDHQSLRDLLASYKEREQRRADGDQTVKAPPTTSWGTLTGWSARFDWVLRQALYADYLQEQDKAEWEQRRREMREAEWEMGNRMRALAGEILDESPQFLRSERTVIPAQNGSPEQIIVTIALDGHLAVRTAEIASKLQRLATDEPTDHNRLSGNVLDELIERELRLAAARDSGQAGDAGPSPKAESGKADSAESREN